MTKETKAFEPSFIQGDSAVKVFSGHTNQISSLAFSPDGKQMLSAAYDDTARLWDIESGREIHCFTHNNWVKTAGFSSDGNRILTGSIDGTSRVWNSQTGLEICRFQDPNKSAQVAAISPDGQLAVSGMEDGNVRLWSTKDGQEIAHLGEHMTGIICVGFSPNGKFALSGNGKAICLYSVENGTEVHRVDSNKSRLRAMAVSADGNQLVSGSEDGIVRLIDIESAKELRSFTGYNRWLHSMAFSPDERTLMAGYDSWQDNKPQLTIRRWNIDNERESRDITFIGGHQMSLSCVAFSKDGQHILSGSNDKTICLWKLPA